MRMRTIQEEENMEQLTLVIQRQMLKKWLKPRDLFSIIARLDDEYVIHDNSTPVEKSRTPAMWQQIHPRILENAHCQRCDRVSGTFEGSEGMIQQSNRHIITSRKNASCQSQSLMLEAQSM
ncbi:hypothetical protein MRB53_040585 [Persea americana]|nr:hypothetical protein MRB53_040585 [Persea americana]